MIEMNIFTDDVELMAKLAAVLNPQGAMFVTTSGAAPTLWPLKGRRTGFAGAVGSRSYGNYTGVAQLCKALS